MPPKLFDLSPTQRRLLIQLWSTPAERKLFDTMSQQWVNAIWERMVKFCEPKELLSLRAAYESVRDFFVTVHNTAVAAGLPGRMGYDGQETRQEVGCGPLPRQETWADYRQSQYEEEGPGTAQGDTGE